MASPITGDFFVLEGLLKERAVKTGDFTLASGRKSDFFVDVKQAVLSGAGHRAVGKVLTHMMTGCQAEAVAGVVLGGCPLASAVSFHSGLPALYVRKESKDHGTKAKIEGTASVKPGAKVVLLEDVTTTGNSSLAAVGVLREAGYKVLGVITLVDRQEGAFEAFDKAGVPFLVIFTREDLA